MTTVKIARRPAGPCANSGQLYTTTRLALQMYRSGMHYCGECGEEAPIQRVGPQAGGKPGNYVVEFLPHDRPKQVRRLVWKEVTFYRGDSFDEDVDAPDESWVIEDV